MSLVTLDEFKQALGETSDTDDARLQDVLDRGTAYIERYCRRTFASATYTTELYDGTGTDTLILRHFPIVSGTTPTVLENGSALTVGTNPVNGVDVLVYHEEGELIRPYGVPFYNFRRWYSVTYQAGYATIPLEIQQACIDLGMIIAQEKDRKGMQSKTVGQQSVSYIRALPKHSQEALEMARDLIMLRAS